MTLARQLAMSSGPRGKCIKEVTIHATNLLSKDVGSDPLGHPTAITRKWGSIAEIGRFAALSRSMTSQPTKTQQSEPSSPRQRSFCWLEAHSAADSYRSEERSSMRSRPTRLIGKAKCTLLKGTTDKAAREDSFEAEVTGVVALQEKVAALEAALATKNEQLAAMRMSSQLARPAQLRRQDSAAPGVVDTRQDKPRAPAVVEGQTIGYFAGRMHWGRHRGGTS